MNIANNVTDLVGNTPLVRIRKLSDGAYAQVVAKLEFYNPAHSVKDRIGVAMIDAAEKAGLINKDTIVFRNKYGYVEKDALIVLTTVGRKKVITNGVGDQVGANFSMILDFANDKGTPGAITITPYPGLTYAVSGTGQYYDIATSVEHWTGLKWQSMYLSYSYKDATYTHQIKDTLVFRDRGIKFSQNTIVIQP